MESVCQSEGISFTSPLPPVAGQVCNDDGGDDDDDDVPLDDDVHDNGDHDDDGDHDHQLHLTSSSSSWPCV